ncbi:hypothetical protein CDAR_518361 [Caerostris darwini]|uniref:Uncharacterized protein n=1 Tax=Caerostris darwini TaxID=1538125 RepID=A0AAV4QX45_9ARAC|nr:hypothetical protein CDAR_518361 [Caerostris darwini]
MWVAVKGDIHVTFFESCGLPVSEIKIHVPAECPKYEMLPTPDWPLAERCMIHLCSDDYLCSKRIAYIFARYLENREKDNELSVLDRIAVTHESLILRILLPPQTNSGLSEIMSNPRYS